MSKIRRPIDILRRTSCKPQIVRALQRVGLGLFLVLVSFALFSYTRAGTRALTRAGVDTRAYAAASSELNFQARLMNASGAIVPDGNSYSVQFKLYDAASGGTLEWTETQGSLTVKNGYLSVHLGSTSAFPSTIDWSQEQWLTMNVNADGEMSPRLKLTAVPLAFRAIQADKLTNGSGSLTASDLAQLAPSSVQAVNTALAALRINQQGAGLLAQLQGSGSDVLTIANNGDVTSTGAASFDGNGTFKGGQLTVGTASQQGNLVLQDGGGHTLTLQSGTQSGNLTFTLPTSAGNNLDCLKTNGSGVLSFSGCAPANAYVNGGNSFGTSATIGTQDSNSLALITGGTQRMLIDTSGNITVGAVDNAASLFVIDTKNTTGDPAGVNGAMYYNSFTNKFRCYENGAWNDCISGANSNASANFVSGLQNVAANATGIAVETMVFTSSTAVSNIAGVTGFTAPADGSFRTCLIKNNAAITAGTLSLRWRVNGVSVGSTICNMDSTNSRQVSGALNPGVVTFHAGDTIGIAFDTSAGFLPAATNDFTVYWGVDYSGATGGGGANFDLQDAYDNSISASVLTANNKDLKVSLADTAIDSNFVVDIQSGSTGKFKVQNNGTDVLTVNSSGDIAASGGLTLGNSTTTTAGTIRWTGLDFEGFDGATWKSLTTGGGGGGGGISSNYVNVVKQVNETVNNSAALQDDDQLKFNVGANEDWTFRFVVQANAATAADLRFAVTAPSGATCYVSANDVETATSEAQLGCGVSSALVTGNATNDMYEITGSVKNGATPGVVTLQWAQFTANASNTIVYTGSYVSAYRTLGSGGAGQPFVQGGNAFGTTATFGTSDNNALNLVTNGTQVLNLATSGLATFSGAVTTNGALTVNSGGLAVTGNGSISGGLTIGTGNALSVSSSGDITGTMQLLNGSSTANGAGTNSTSLVLASVTNFDVGNYVQVSSTNCTTGVNICYAKITAINVGTNTLTISPALTWANSSAVKEYHVPELGGSDTTQALANRFGRGYFISGIATGNGTTYYNEDSIQTSLTNFDLLNTNVTTLNIGGAATTLNLGGVGTTTTIGGTVQFTGNVTAPATGTSGYLSRSGTTLSPSNSGDNFTTSGNISTTGTGTITSAGAITGATSGDTINGLVINAGALSSITTLNASGLATVNGLDAGAGQITNTGGLSISGTSSINGNSITSSQFTFGGAGTVTTSSNGDLTLVPNGSGALVLNTGSGGTASTNITTLQRIASGGLTFDLKDGSNTTLTLNNSGAGAANLNLSDGGLYTAGTQRVSNGGALQNVTGDNTDGVSFNANVITGGTLSTARGGTGVNGSSAANGQLLIGNGSGYTLAGLTNNGGLTITNGAGSIGLAVNYGSSSTTAVRGDTGLVCASGTGNLTGGGNTITLGSGGTCNALDTGTAVSFGTSVTTPLLTNSGALGINTANSTVANTGNITIKSGDASTGANLSAGTVTFDTGTKTGAGTAVINIGNTNATSLVLGNANTSTSLNGTGLTLGSGLNTITRTAAGTTTFNLVDAANTTVAFTNSGAGNLNLSADGTITAGSGLTVSANGASISGGLNNNSGGITAAGSITGVGTNITATAGLTIGSGGSGDLAFDSATNKLVIASTDTTLQRTAAGSFTVDLNDGSATTLVLNNSGTGAASLNLSDGGLQVAGTSVLTNGAALQNLTGFGQSSGNFAISGTGTFATASGAVGLNGATTISTSANSTTALTINGTTGTAATAASIAQTGAAGNLAMTNTAATSQALVSLTQSTSAYTGTGLLFNFASGSGSFASGNFLDFQLNGTSRFKIDNTGALTINSSSANALKITNTSGVSYFNVDATGNQITVGAADATTVLFVLDSSSTSTDPGVVAGAMYYRTSDNQFRCSTSAVWKDCLTGGEFSATLASNHAITNAGLTDVSGFSYTANSGETWEVEIRGATSGNNTTGDVACDLITTGTWGTGQSYNEGTHYAGNGALTNRTATAAASTTTSAGVLTVNNGDGVVRPFHLTYRFVMTGTGTVKFQCGNAAAAAGRTSTLNSGASMIARRVD